MVESFKFRYVNELVGLFVLIIVALLVAGIVLAGKAQGWFIPKYEVRLVLPEEGSLGLRKGAEVQVMESPVGRVMQVELGDEGRLEAVLQLQGDITTFVRLDSVAILKRKFAVAGDAYVELTRGAGEPLPRSGAYLDCRADTDLIKMVESTVETIRQSALEALDKLKALLDEHTVLASQLNSPEGHLQQMLGSMDTVTRGLADGEGSAGRLLRDPTAARDIEKLLAAINESVEKVNRLLDNVDQTVAGLPDLTASVDQQVNRLPDVMNEAVATMQDVQVLLEGLQRHWLLRKYIKTSPAGAPLPPESLGATR